MSEKRKCSAKTKAGKPCKSSCVKGIDTCLAHAPREFREKRGFRADNGKGGRPKAPRAVDVIRARIEENMEPVLGALFDALSAEQGLALNVKGGGMEIGYVADHPTRIKAARELLDRAYGRPKQTTELTGEGGGPIETRELIPSDADFHTDVAHVIAEAERVTAGANGSGPDTH